MKKRAARLMFSAAFVLAGAVIGVAVASAQTFQNYHCVDGTRFIVAFYDDDSRAHLQIDGQAVTLAKRLTWSGSRYSGEGVSLKITTTGVSVRLARRQATVCEVDVRPQ